MSGNGGNFLILDLTRVEGAQVLERELFLYPYAERIKNKIDEFKRLGTEEEPSEESVNEFFATNIFINGKRGTGKTSVLLTVYKEIKDNDLLVLPIIDLSTNVQSVLVYILSYIKENYYEKLNTKSCCEEKLDELFYKLELNFPIFLKCFCETACKYLCDREIEEILDKNELNYISLLHRFLKAFLNSLNKKKLVILIDDFDLVVDEKVLVRIVIELAIFLNLKEVIIVGAGDLENLLARLIKFFSKDLDKERAEEVAKSYIEKLFSLRNVVDIPPIDIYSFKEHVRIKVNNKSANAKNELKTFDAFLKAHISLEHILDVNSAAIYYILDGLPLRQLVQFLKAVYERAEFANNKNILKLSEYLISPIFISLVIDSIPYANMLKTNFSSELEIRKKEVKNLSPDDIWNVFKSFNEFMKALFEKEDIIKNAFTWRKIREFRGYRYRFISYLKGYNRKLYGVLYIWLAEMLIYFKQPVFPLFAIALSFLYGLPNVTAKLDNLDRFKESRGVSKEEEYEDLLTFNDYLKIVEFTDFSSFDDSLNYLLANFEAEIPYGGKGKKKYERYILFGKILRGRGKLRFYFYKLLHNTYVDFILKWTLKECDKLDKMGIDIDKIIGKEKLEILLYDVYSTKEEGRESTEQKQKEKYYEKLLNLCKDYYCSCIFNNLIYDPELFDKRINALIRRSINIAFKKSIKDHNYKYIFSIYFPFLLLLSSIQEYNDKWATPLFKESLWKEERQERKQNDNDEVRDVLCEIIKDLEKENLQIAKFLKNLIELNKEECRQNG